MVHYSSYWRGGPVLNSALSGVDQALWDIMGKRAGMPVYELLGGRVRAAADTYLHAEGATIEATLDHARQLLDSGYRNVRLQTGAPGLGHYGAPGSPNGYPDVALSRRLGRAALPPGDPAPVRTGPPGAGRGAGPAARRPLPAHGQAGDPARAGAGAVPAVLPGGPDRARVLRPAARGPGGRPDADRGRGAARVGGRRGAAGHERRASTCCGCTSRRSAA